jgi:biotin synthase
MWADRPPPALQSYRRIQAARYLMVMGACRAAHFSFSPSGEINSYGLSLARLRELLDDGRAFQTAGCPSCNRPYYNERPGKAMYNYPRPLHAAEIETAISAVIAGLACG